MLSSRIAPIRKTRSAARQKVRVLCMTSAIVLSLSYRAVAAASLLLRGLPTGAGQVPRAP